MTALRWGIFTSGVRGGTNILNSVTQDNSFSVTQCNKQGIIFHSFHLSHLTRAKEPLIAQKNTQSNCSKYSKEETVQLGENQVKSRGTLVPVQVLHKSRTDCSRMLTQVLCQKLTWRYSIVLLTLRKIKQLNSI